MDTNILSYLNSDYLITKPDSLLNYIDLPMKCHLDQCLLISAIVLLKAE